MPKNIVFYRFYTPVLYLALNPISPPSWSPFNITNISLPWDRTTSLGVSLLQNLKGTKFNCVSKLFMRSLQQLPHFFDLFVSFTFDISRAGMRHYISACPTLKKWYNCYYILVGVLGISFFWYTTTSKTETKRCSCSISHCPQYHAIIWVKSKLWWRTATNQLLAMCSSH